MGIEQQSGVPKWILIATGVVGLVAAIFMAVARYYEINRARAEAARAQLETEQRERELRGRPTPVADPKPPTPTLVNTPRPAPKSATDRDRLQGKWVCTFEQIGGRDFTPAELVAANKTMEVRGDVLTIRRFQKGAVGEYRGEVVLRDDNMPKLFDLTGFGPGGGRVELLGVYAFEGNEFKLCYKLRVADDPVRERAESFSTAAGGARVYVRFRRTGD